MESVSGWSVVQLDHDEEMGPMHGVYGTLDAELEVQRTIKRAERSLQYAANLYCVVEKWKDCEELNPKAERKVDFH